MQELPLFPLGTVLFPGGWLPLQIFELRYLDMVGRAWREGTPFGVVMLTEGREVQQPAADEGGAPGFAPESFHRLGTLAHVRELQRPQPGLLRIRCEGGRRFRLHGQRRSGAGLWIGQVELLPAEATIEVPGDLEATALSLRVVLDEVRSQWAQQGGDTPPPLPAEEFVDDCGWVAHRWAELLPLTPSFKQQLLATDSPLLRLELVADVLDRLRRNGPGAQGPAT